MKYSPNIKAIINKYHTEIAGWVDQAALIRLPWPQVVKEIERREKLGDGLPSADGLRKAWLRMNSAQTAQKNPPQTTAVKPSTPFSEPQNSPPAQTAPIKQTAQTIVPQTAVVAASDQPKKVDMTHADLLAIREEARRKSNLKTFASAFDDG